jgi:hypothetical protein
MYMPSAQDERSKQARAMAKALCQWGCAEEGQELTIAHPVCKGKFRPWKGAPSTAPERQYGCYRHHKIRKLRIEKVGLRDGWESFDQWPCPSELALAGIE